MGEGSYIALFSPSDVTAFHRIAMDIVVSISTALKTIGSKRTYTNSKTSGLLSQLIFKRDFHRELDQCWTSVVLAGIVKLTCVYVYNFEGILQMNRR